MKYSPSTNSFYDPELFTLELGNLPEDAVDIADELHASCAGQSIKPLNGLPVVVPPEPAKGAELEKYIRQQRNLLLAASDWTDGRSIDSATFNKWAPYRKALRDIPQQPGFPGHVVWPVSPDDTETEE